MEVTAQYCATSHSTRTTALTKAPDGTCETELWPRNCGLGITVLITEILIRTYVHLDAYQQTGTARLDLPQTRRRNELLLASHSLVSAISLGKVATQASAHCVAGNYLHAAHPSHIRHANIPTLLRAVALARTLVNDAYRASKIPSAHSWDNLIFATAQPWQLDLVEGIKNLGSSEISTALGFLD